MKITESLKIIKKIVEDPGNAEQHDPLMVATTYAGQCEVVNDRLKKCQSLIQKHMVPQAHEEAGYDPHLIDLCTEMNETAPVAWRKLCKEKGWPVPESLNMEAFNELMNSFSIESSIEPLLRQLRRANNKGDAGQCVAVLRELVKQDLANPDWKSSLTEFETAYLDQIKKDFEEFRQKKNINGVARLIVELKQPWTIPIDTISVQEMENFIEAQYRENLLQEEQEIVSRVSIAFQSGNVDALGDAIAAYENLEKKRFFTPDPSLHVIYANALHWYQQQIKAIEVEKDYKNKLAHINEKISNGSHEGIKKLWEEIKRFPFPVPEEIEPDVKILIVKEKQAKRGQQRKKQMGYIMLLVFAMVCVCLAATWNYYRQIKNRLISDLDAAVVSEDLPQCNEVVADMASRQIAFIEIPLFSSTDMGKQRDKAKQVALSLEKKRALFQVLITELEDMMAQGFSAGTIEETEGKIKQIIEAASAVTPAKIARLAIVQAAWEERKRVIKAMEEKELTAVFEKITSQFKNILPAVTSEEIEINEITFQKVEELIAQGTKFGSVSDSMKKSLSDFQKQLDSTRQTMAVRIEQLREIMSAGSLETYIRALKIFSETFPDDLLSKAVKITIEMEKKYNYLLSPPQINPSDSLSKDADSQKSGKGTDNKKSDMENLQRTNDPENPFWSSTYEIIKAFSNNIRTHEDEVQEELNKMGRTARFVDLWECTVNRPNFEPEKWYFNGKPTQEFIKGVKSYAGIAYILSADDIQPEFKANNAITIQVQDLKKMDHCDVVEQMISNILYDIGPESIMKEIKNIYNQNFSAILKLHLISFLTDQLFVLVGKDNALPFIEMVKDFKRFNNQVNWLCTANSRYTSESRQAEAILNHHLQRPDGMNGYIAQLKIQKSAMKRIPRWVGFADLKNPEQLHLKTGKMPNEIWVVRNSNIDSGRNSTPKNDQQSGQINKNEETNKSEETNQSQTSDRPVILVTQERILEETLKHLDHKGYLPGEPLFAPYDNRTTRELLIS
ncbi:MAG: hypothetical protein HQK65_10990, partial [Desulfamplus sp.]|nr:hypothetical protein [Desulfamplus sp.]